MTEKPILIVDDVESQLTLFSAALREAGHSVLCANTFAQAVELAREHKPDVVFCDIVLPDGDGIALIEAIRLLDADVKPIAITAFATVNRAVEAMRGGAVDFLVKPVSAEQIVTAVTNVRAGRSISLPRKEALSINEPIWGHVGASAVMQDVYATVQAVAGSTAPIFITGESGTGKALCAEAIHRLSGFSEGAFVKIDCSTLTPEALEVDLFGRRGGAGMPKVTGAVAEAEGGTLFIDEVHSLPANLQARLQGMLQSGRVTPLGSLTPERASCRLICASSRDPRVEMDAGRFRADLYYRLNVVPIHLPPLHARGMDVLEIAEAELIRLSGREGGPTRSLSTEVKALFLDYEWPGNIRELCNLLWHVAVVSDNAVVEKSDLPPSFLPVARDADLTPPPTPHRPDLIVTKGRTLAQIERMVIEAAIVEADGSIPQAAKALDVSPSTLYRKLESWGRPARGSRRHR